MVSVLSITADKLKLGGRLFEYNGNKENIILHIPGMAGDIYDAPYYAPMTENYPKNRVSFLAGETRSYHEKETKGKEYTSELFEDSLLDIDCWIKLVVQLGYENIWLQASSLGPTKIVNWYFKRKPTNIAGLIFLSPSDMVGLVHDKEGIKDHQIMISEAKKMALSGKGTEEISHLLWGVKTLTTNAYLSLFGDNSEAAIFNYGDPSLGWEKINSIDIPVLSFTCTNDDGIFPVIDVHKAMRMLSKELINCQRKRLIVYEDWDHDFNGLWDKIINDTLDFIFHSTGTSQF